MINIVNKLFGSIKSNSLKKYASFVEKVNKLEEVISQLSDQELKNKTNYFRNEFKQRPGWEKGSPRRANNIQEYAKKEARQGKANMPGHVRASINWNNLKRIH